MLSTVEVTVRYHLVTHHPVSCDRMSYYLFLLPIFITYYRLSGDVHSGNRRQPFAAYPMYTEGF
jgi:hypothetical protein